MSFEKNFVTKNFFLVSSKQPEKKFLNIPLSFVNIGIMKDSYFLFFYFFFRILRDIIFQGSPKHNFKSKPRDIGSPCLLPKPPLVSGSIPKRRSYRPLYSTNVPDRNRENMMTEWSPISNWNPSISMMKTSLPSSTEKLRKSSLSPVKDSRLT